MKNLIAFLLFAFLLTSCHKVDDLFFQKSNKSARYSNKVILEWNEVAFELSVSLGHPVLMSRINTMMHLAIHDALNSIDRRYEAYAFEAYNHKADEKAAIATAAYTVLVNSLPDFKPQYDALLARHLAEVKAGDKKKDDGIMLGKKAAEHILDLRKDDGAFDVVIVVDVPPSNVPGVYQAVPPLAFNYSPGWKDMTPFSLLSPQQFRSQPHPTLESDQYAEDFNEVKEIGAKNSASRTEDVGLAAIFWNESSETGWNRIARVVIEKEKTGLYETARLFALLNMALQDSYIAGFNSKIYYNFWRPYTAILKAETDGNAATTADPSWESLVPTPPVPDYPSTHSALGNAGASVLIALLGDEIGFSFTSTTSVTVDEIRSFNSFKEAADKNAASRVEGGMHFRAACNAGQKLGDEVGEWTMMNYLQPL
jgi:hypothetical protein